jgi:hypothetical protein
LPDVDLVAVASVELGRKLDQHSLQRPLRVVATAEEAARPIVV